MEQTKQRSGVVEEAVGSEEVRRLAPLGAGPQRPHLRAVPFEVEQLLRIQREYRAHLQFHPLSLTLTLQINHPFLLGPQQGTGLPAHKMPAISTTVDQRLRVCVAQAVCR